MDREITDQPPVLRRLRAPARAPSASGDVPWRGREWLVANGIGGYASASVADGPTRKYHGLLVAALPNPWGRTVMLNHLVERVVLRSGTRVPLGGCAHLREFRLETGLPVWRLEVAGALLEKRIVMPHRQNTVFIVYRCLEGDEPLQLELQAALHFRHHEHEVTAPIQEGYRLTLADGGCEIDCDQAPAILRLKLWGEAIGFTQDARQLPDQQYPVEQERGLAHQGQLWSPGFFTVRLAPRSTVALVASTEPEEVLTALAPTEALAAEAERRRKLLLLAPARARSGAAAELVLAADQFIITPAGRRRDAARAAAEGDEVRSVIAGYHWFTDWGRDTMISLEGLTLATGRLREAASILLTFAHYVRDGLLPNMFPDGSNEGLYHTADATLWFFHAVDRYLHATQDEALLRRLMPTLQDIARHHLAGTRFGIGVDPADGLLHQGAEGYQLTWMDAKCEGWVVTPRRGKAVEINALWHNALALLDEWSRRLGDARSARSWADHAAQARASFNHRFWYAQGGYLYDVVDGPDGDSTECRPNQLFAVSLPRPVLDRSRWDAVLNVVQERLVTPMGLRSLAPGSACYAKRYFGNLRQRDAAYHQGTVWAWLIGPWVDAWRKWRPEEDPQPWLAGLLAHLDESGVGTIGEIFDAEAPYTPRGCIAQAWSVAEVLRHLAAPPDGVTTAHPAG
jgi:predicted glycogen debranching enzyme